jgi:CHAD domain-containing protein
MAKAKLIPGIDREAPLLVNAGMIIGTRLAEMLAYERYVYDEAAVYELHQMRIAAKRLRYTLELFEDAYAEFVDMGGAIHGITDEVKTLQDCLGEIHDADVLAPQLAQHLARMLRPAYGKAPHGEPIAGVHRTDYNAGIGLLALCQQIRELRERHYRRLLDHWHGMKERGTLDRLRALLQTAMLKEI